MITLSKEHSDYVQDAAVSSPCKVIVFYDDVRSRERVLTLSDRLVPQFWEDFEFEISWWKVNFIKNLLFHEAIIKELMSADIIIFALSPAFEVGLDIKESMEFLMRFRTNNQGLLVMALTPSYSPQDQYRHTHQYLASLAESHGLDYLSEWAMKLKSAQMDDASQRIGPIDSTPPTEGQHWGINE